MQELNSIREGKYWDDAKGGWLDPILVWKAREEEMQHVKTHGVCEKVPMSQCWKETGKNPIKTGWADTNVRVSEHGITSLLEGVKLVITGAASSNQVGTLLLVIDVRRAYFHANARRRVCIELQVVGSAGCCKRVCVAPETLLKTGKASLEASWRRLACAEDKRARACTPKRRGESALQSMEDAEWLIRKFKERYEVKTQMIGEAADLDKQLQILNRTVRWSSRALWIEADPRHVKEVIKALGLEGASPAPTPGVAVKGETRVEDSEGSTGPELVREENTMFRAVAARMNYLSQDRPDFTFATMKLCSKMFRPDAKDLKNLKRVGRFLTGRPRVGCLFEWQAHARPC